MATSTVLVDRRAEPTRLEPAVLRPGGALATAWIASAVVVVLVAVASALGVWVTDLYPEADWAVASLRGNDLVSLVLIVPLLTAALVGVRSRHQASWALLWLGALLYDVYNYAYYVFGTAFNDVFLLHVAALALSLVALVFLAASLDARAVAGPVRWSRRDHVVAVYMGLVGLALIGAWGALSLRFALTGELPEDVMPPEAVHLVYAIDLSLLAPSFLVGAVLLWQRVPWGYVAGVAVNVFAAAYLAVLTVVGGFMANAGIEGKTWLSWPSIIGALLCATAAAVLLRQRSPTR